MSSHRLDPSVDELWKTYKATGGLELRNRLVLQYAPLVKYVAGRIGSGLPDSVDHADLVSDGVIGLMDAIEKFDPDRGWQFQTYAVRNKIREIERAQVDLWARLGRSPSDIEIADEMQIPVRELRDIYAKVSYTSLASLDELGGVEDLAPATSDGVEDGETREALMDAVEGLPERDRIIVALYYFEGLTLAEIGLVLRVTESRVSQLHTRATLALRAQLHTAQH